MSDGGLFGEEDAANVEESEESEEAKKKKALRPMRSFCESGWRQSGCNVKVTNSTILII